MTLRGYDFRLIFVLCAALILMVCVAVLHSAAFAVSPNVIAGAVAGDLLITLPLLYYFCVVRTKRAAPLTLLPVFLIGLTAVKLLIPVTARGFLQPLLLLSAPLEVFSVGLLVYRLYRGRTQATGNTSECDKSYDRFERFSQRAKAAAGGNVLLDLALTEMAVFYYGLFGWFVRPAALSGNAFTCHRKSGWSGLLGVVIFLILVEGATVHLALSGWNVYAAWIWNAFDLYLILFLLADYQAMRLRPLLLTDTTLLARFGLRWSGEIPLDQIASVVPFSPTDSKVGGAEYQKIALLSDPEFLITLHEPILFSGLLGRTKRVKRLGVRVDDPELFVRLQYILCNAS